MAFSVVMGFICEQLVWKIVRKTNDKVKLELG